MSPRTRNRNYNFIICSVASANFQSNLYFIYIYILYSRSEYFTFWSFILPVNLSMWKHIPSDHIENDGNKCKRELQTVHDKSHSNFIWLIPFVLKSGCTIFWHGIHFRGGLATKESTFIYHICIATTSVVEPNWHTTNVFVWHKLHEKIEHSAGKMKQQQQQQHQNYTVDVWHRNEKEAERSKQNEFITSICLQKFK